MGLNFKLDVGLYRLDQQVACQRYRQTTIDAKTPILERLAALNPFKGLSLKSEFAFATA